MYSIYCGYLMVCMSCRVFPFVTNVYTICLPVVSAAASTVLAGPVAYVIYVVSVVPVASISSVSPVSNASGVCKFWRLCCSCER